ncbi:MAG: hypothetical protein H0T09_04025, partial [Actinobacteria bacterium]|nr:hypothetical protein [Actinomycetota bacterium]
VTSDPTGQLPGVWLVYNEIRPRSIEPSVTSYSSAGSGRVGQSLTYVIRSIDDGQTWSNPVAVDPNLRGHQFFPDIDALSGRLGVVWQDNRTDPFYSVQFPIGNVLIPGLNRAFSSAYFATPYGNIVNSFFAGLTSANTMGFTFGTSEKVSTKGHQSQYEMFGSRQTPFHGDYNWIQMATLPPELNLGTVYAYMTWTDNRDVVPGVDPRETQSDPNPGFIDGFDVQQCRTDLGTVAQGLGSADIPLARRDAPFTGDTCGNAGGLDQNIYGAGKLIP